MSERADVQPFEDLLQYLRQTRGFDFTAYRRSSLIRRVNRRMQAVDIDAYEEYFDFLRIHPGEFTALFNTVLINVTSFFRDEDVWTYLQTTALPAILAEQPPDAPLRVWVAGCASGEEAYSILMLLAELMGSDAVRERVKVYATDADEDALAEARLAAYSPKQVEGIPAPFLEKYFESAATSHTVKPDLRRSVVFGRHDLIQDAPISGVDLLLCRNTLMYFNADTQSRILTQFFFSLNPGGHILLGSPEMLFSHANLFRPVDLKRRLFRVVPRPSQGARLASFC